MEQALIHPNYRDIRLCAIGIHMAMVRGFTFGTLNDVVVLILVRANKYLHATDLGTILRSLASLLLGHIPTLALEIQVTIATLNALHGKRFLTTRSFERHTKGTSTNKAASDPKTLTGGKAMPMSFIVAMI
jgi:hypothetical protein